MTALVPMARVAEAGEWSLMIETLASSFEEDPAVRWMYPDVHQYHRHFPAFVRAFGGRAITHGTAYCADWYSGVALWLPPGIGPDEDALAALLEATVGERERPAILAMFELMGSYHPNEEHWYLPLLGVEASRRDEGYGSALMRTALMRCDEEKRPAYLEATSRQSLSFYERHGFAQLGTIRVADSPPVFPMLRPAR